MNPITGTAVVRQLWPLLLVQEMERSLEFYQDRLGFKLADRADADGKTYWCRLERDGTSIMLQQACAEDEPVAGRGVVLYFLCDDAEAMFAELSARGLALSPPRTAWYGMQQFQAPDPDGYAVWFESVVEERPAR